MMTTTAAEPITVTISHRLGRDAAKQRIESGLDSIRADIQRYASRVEYRWEGYTLEFSVTAMMQSITGRIEVYEEFVRIELGLPRLLHMIAKTIAGQIERRGASLLEGPKPKS
jgi:hypothetical protein